MYSSRNCAALRERDLARRVAAGKRGCLLENPRVAQRAAADEHAGHAAVRSRSTICAGSTQSPLPNTGIRSPAATRAIRSQSEEPE